MAERVEKEKETQVSWLQNPLIRYAFAFFWYLLTIGLVTLISRATTGTSGGIFVLMGFALSMVGLNLLYLKKRRFRGTIVTVLGAFLFIFWGLLPMLSGSIIGTIIALPLMVMIVLGIGYFVLARYNAFFTIIEEGYSKIVLRAGRFKRVLIQWEGYTLDPEGNIVKIGVPIKEGLEVPEGTPGATIYRAPTSFELFLMGNLFGGFWLFSLVWPFDSIHTYKFEWVGVDTDGQPRRHEPRLVDYVFLKDDLYYRFLGKIEDVNKVPLDFETVFTIRVLNPSKALFRVEHWLENTLNRIVSELRKIVGKFSYEDITTKEGTIGKILEQLQVLLDNLRREWGVLVREIRFIRIDPPEEIRQDTIKMYLAQREAERIVVEAEARRQELNLRGEGEALRIGHVYDKLQSYGNFALAVRWFEALEKGQTNWIVPAGFRELISEITSAILGKPLSPEEITPQQAKAILEILKKEVEKEKRRKKPNN